MALRSAQSLSSFLLGPVTCLRALQPLDVRHFEHYFTWIQSGEFRVGFDFAVDRLTAVMLLVVTGVGLLIHIYSTGYMEHDAGYYRFFAYLNLFMFFMLTLVLAANFLLLFVGWEGVGLCSYLLIGFYFDRKSATDAGNKAFIVNRIGDFGFSLAMFLIVITFGTLDFGTVFQAARRQASRTSLTAICPAAAGGRLRQVRAVSSLRVAAGRDGRSHAGLRPDPRGDHGDRRRLHGRALVRLVRPLRQPRSNVVAMVGTAHRDFRRHHRPGAERHQEGLRLLHGFAARVHVPGPGLSGLSRRAFST